MPNVTIGDTNFRAGKTKFQHLFNLISYIQWVALHLYVETTAPNALITLMPKYSVHAICGMPYLHSSLPMPLALDCIKIIRNNFLTTPSGKIPHTLHTIRFVRNMLGPCFIERSTGNGAWISYHNYFYIWCNSSSIYLTSTVKLPLRFVDE